MGPFAECFNSQLAIRTKSCHCDMGGVLLFEFPLLSLNAGIPLRIKSFGIDLCHDNDNLLCDVKIVSINIDKCVRISKLVALDQAKGIQTNGKRRFGNAEALRHFREEVVFLWSKYPVEQPDPLAEAQFLHVTADQFTRQ